MARIQTWMKNNIEDHRDPVTGEINVTGLAEDAAREFNLYDGDEPQERLFKWAFTIADRDAAQHSGHIGSAARGLIQSQDNWLRS